MRIGTTICQGCLRATGLGMALLGLLTWNGNAADAGWRLFVQTGARRVTQAPANILEIRRIAQERKNTGQ